MADLVLILAPTGRDAAIVQRLLGRENIDCQICPSLETLNQAISDETGVVLIADEALGQENLTPLARHLTDQPPWSDLPFIVLTRSDAVARRTLVELNLPKRSETSCFSSGPSTL
jgi:DNA-binding response OmpR family regulator